MKILVINCGSSSLKFSLFDMDGHQSESMVSGRIDAIGKPECRLTLNPGPVNKIKSQTTPLTIDTHTQAVEQVLQTLTDKSFNILHSLDQIHAVGHRVVHGGETFVSPTRINAIVTRAIEQFAQLAPLHNPINLEGIRAIQAVMPDTPQVAVFDTAFHQTMAPEAFLYAIPYGLYETYHIRRYGFHGTSHQSVFFKTAAFLAVDPKALKAIICHLGSGASISAVDGGKVIETSMGFTPLEGLVMGTRSGDIDPSIIPFLIQKTGLTMNEVEDILNKKSGLLGITGMCDDMRTILDAADNDNKRCKLAIDIYVHRIVKYIGAYVSILNGTDVIVFTAGLGEKSPPIRKKIMDRLSWLKIQPDDTVNEKTISTPSKISKNDTGVTVLVIPTDEEKQIAEQTAEQLKK